MRQPRRPTYQGRALPRPDEDIVDQGLGFDLGTLLGRRQLLRAVGLGASALGLAACDSRPADSGPVDSGPVDSASSGTAAPGAPSTSGTATTAGEIPEETAGPYPGDGSNGPDVLEQSGVVRSDIRRSFGTADGTAQGVPMTLELTVLDLSTGGAPFAGAAVYVWHCDREARYSLYSDGVTGENYLRGVQIADAQGTVRFTSIFPACYSGRWPHVHFEVYRDRAGISDAGDAIATSQVALPKDACDAVYAQPGYETSVSALSRVSLRDDNVFGGDGGAAQLGTVTGDVTRGFTVALPVRIDPRTAPTGGQLTGDGAPPGAPPGRGTGPSALRPAVATW